MAKCEICSKDVHFGIQVSRSHRRSNKMWKSNVRKIRVNQNGTVKTMNVCTRCLRSNLVARA